MPDLVDGESTQVKGSGSSLYTLKNTAGVYSCSCPAWMHQSIAIEKRTCKHLRAYRGEALETERVGVAGSAPRPRPVRAFNAGSAASAESGDASRAGAEGEAPADAEPPLLLAHKWEMDVDLAGWWMSEKLDGVRAYWDGENFFSRLGNLFHVPDWFKEGLPKTPLDGELFGGRKRFQRTVGIVKRQDKSDAWREIRYVVFDAPAEKGPFEDRLAHCERVLEGLEWAAVHAHEVCRDNDHLREQLAFVESLGGEGLMMRKPGSLYEAGRSFTLLKVKTFFDAEAKVIDHVPGTGKHKGRLGSLLVQLQDGTRFNVGTGFSDAERENPPPIGALITFRYQELSDGGVPRFPSYVAVRDDVRWEATTLPKPSTSTPTSTPTPTSTQPSPGDESMKRYEFSEGSSNKFWEITLEGASFTTRYGKIGTDGQVTLKEFDSPDKAKKEYEKLIVEKEKKGYVLVAGKGGGAAKPSAAKASDAKASDGRRKTGTGAFGGRSFLKGEVTADELRKLCKAFDEAEPLLDDDLLEGEYDTVLVDGDLTLPNLVTFDHDLCFLCVTGNLTVNGNYADSDDPATGVVVLGDFRAKNVDTTGTLCVRGDTIVEECLVGFYNDYSADLRGAVKARVFVPENHHFTLTKAPQFDAVLGSDAHYRVPEKLRGSIKALSADATRALLVDELWDEDEESFDYDGLRDRIRAGKSVFRPAGKTAGKKAEPAKKSSAASGGARRFELVEGSSSKFWEIQLEGSTFTTRYGKIGTDGQVTLKELDSAEKAKKEYDKLVAEKTKKGYVEK